MPPGTSGGSWPEIPEGTPGPGQMRAQLPGAHELRAKVA